MKKKSTFLSLILAVALCVQLFAGCSTTTEETTSADLSSIPEFSNQPYVEINNNEPYFTDDDYTTTSFEKYSELDSLGRCGVAYSCIGSDLMPTEKRGNIGSVKPTGWQISKYDFVDGKYLYNRCHLIGYQLTAENANEKNLITGTRYMNVDGMLPFENLVADYIKETDNHVLYRVTPIFEGNNLVANGVLMEAKSVEDKGEGVCFNVFCYNNQPNVTINYADGSNYLTSSGKSTEATTSNSSTTTSKTTYSSSGASSTYILNTNNKKVHLSSCRYASKISSKNKETYNGSLDTLLSEGYELCKVCIPE